MSYALIKYYDNFGGLDLKNSDLLRGTNRASSMTNAQYTKTGALEKRRGYKAFASSTGGHGLFTYNRMNPTSGDEEPEIVSAGNSLNKLITSTLTVSYSGAESYVVLSIYFDTASDAYKCDVQEAATVLLSQNLGKGFDEATPYTVDQLRAAIDALTNFSATLSGATTTPAAFLSIVRDHNLTESNYLGEAKYWIEINKTVSSPLAGSETNKNATDWENVSFTQINNVTYAANGYDNIIKYDGQTQYRAGIIKGITPSTAKVGSGSITDSDVDYISTYIQIDAVGNVIEGNASAVSTNISSLASEDVDVTVTNIEAGTGFNTNCAIVAGAQSGVNTITVDDGSGGSHTIKSGDTAYFFDGVSSSYVSRNVTAVAATTITVDGAAVNVADNAVISNNLRIGIYRSTAGGTTFYLVAEIPNDSFNTTQVYRDSTTSATLVGNAQFITPLADRSPPPIGKYLSTFRNLLVIGNIEDLPNDIIYSDIDGPEYFPNDGTTQIRVESSAGDSVTGVSPNNEVFIIFKKFSIFTISGNLTEGDIRVDLLTSDIGCVAHATIHDVRGRLYFLSDRSVYSMSGGQIPEPIGEPIEPVFDQAGVSETADTFLWLKRATAINDREQQKYILFIPAESEDASNNRYANTSSRVFVHDYYRAAWLEWNNINAAGGMAILDRDLYFQERRLSDFTGTVDHILYRFNVLGTTDDYMDHDDAVDFIYKPQWEFLGQPAVYKRFLRMKIYPLETGTANQFNVDVDMEINFVNNVVVATHNIDFTTIGEGYGIEPYGTSAYGSIVDFTNKFKLASGKFRAFRPTFKNAVKQQNIQLTGWELEVADIYRRQMIE